jgi:hypothetical protein
MDFWTGRGPPTGNTPIECQRRSGPSSGSLPNSEEAEPNTLRAFFLRMSDKRALEAADGSEALADAGLGGDGFAGARIGGGRTEGVLGAPDEGSSLKRTVSLG